MSCAEVHPNLAAFVLDGLEPEVAAEVRRHLASCPRCQDEVRELRKVNRALEAAPPPADPPSYLKDGILSRVRAEQLSVSEMEEPQGSSFEDRTESSRTSRFNRLKDLRVVLPSAAAAAIFAFVTLGVFSGFLREKPPVATIQLVPTPARPSGSKGTGVWPRSARSPPVISRWS
jgi:anti-sigma factor RsiW